MQPEFFEVVRDAFEGFVAGVPGRRSVSVHGRGLKSWFDDDTREHYECQLIRVDGDVQLEIGFHAEHPKAPMNDEVLRRLVVAEPQWRSTLGNGPVAGSFIGRAGWCRISEVWRQPDAADIDEAIEAAARLADYVIALEPIRRAVSP
jgi:hypothetical protein